jgi:uncharacterized protein
VTAEPPHSRRRMSPEEVYARAARLPLFVVFSRPTSRFTWETEEGRELMRAHLQWQLEREDEGRLLAAGPLNHGEPVTVDDPIVNAGGMYVMAAASRAQAETIAAEDPFHLAGWRTYTVRTWLLNEGIARSLGPQLERFGSAEAGR